MSSGSRQRQKQKLRSTGSRVQTQDFAQYYHGIFYGPFSKMLPSNYLMVMILSELHWWVVIIHLLNEFLQSAIRHDTLCVAIVCVCVTGVASYGLLINV